VPVERLIPNADRMFGKDHGIRDKIDGYGVPGMLFVREM
jgi:hypothetical protein